MAHSVVVKKEEKVKHIFDLLGDDLTEENFKEKFKSIYPKDWQRIISTYNKHERKTKTGKKHPMPNPEKYLSNMFKVYYKKLIG